MNLIEAAKKRIKVFAKTLNKNTYKQYGEVWTDFLHYLENECVPPVLDASALQLSTIELYLSRWSMNPPTFLQRRSAIFKLLEAVEDDNPSMEFPPTMPRWSKKLKVRKVAVKERLFLTKDELDIAEDVAGMGSENLGVGNRETSARNGLLFKLMRETWMRVDEVTLINIKDINFNTGILGVRGKGAASNNKGQRAISDHIQLSPELLSKIQDYIRSYRVQCEDESVRPSLEIPETIRIDAPLFTSNYKRRLSTRSIQNITTKAIEMAYERPGNIVGNHGAHCIRRSEASLFYSRTNNIVATSRKLRHADLKTTMIYLGIEKLEDIDNMGVLNG